MRGKPYVIALVVGALLGCGKTAVTVPIRAVGTPVEVAFIVAPSTRLRFAMHAAKYSYSGDNKLLLEVDLLKGGELAGQMSCSGMTFDDGSGSACGSTQYSSACAVDSGPQGADTMRVRTRMEKSHRASIEGLELRVLE